MPKLLISLPTGDVSKELMGDMVTIGRTADNRIQIDHHTVSAHHASLIFSNGNYKIKDLGSTNRTCVNGMPVNEAELTGSCILRIGSVECVYKAEKNETTNMPDQLQFQLTELQRQIENLMRARDLIHQQNRVLVKERDDARQEADIASEELSDARKQLALASSNTSRGEVAGEVSEQLAESRKQVDSLTGERDALTSERDALTSERDELSISNQELKSQLAMLTSKVGELQQKITQAAMQQHVAASVQQHVSAAAQEKAIASVKAEMDESVVEDEFEEEAELAGAVQKTATVGGSVGRFISGAPLLSSWLNRGSKRKAPAPAPEQPAEREKITPMPPPAPAPAPALVEAETKTIAEPNVEAADAPQPALKLVTPPPVPEVRPVAPPSSAVKIGRAAANAAPNNPEIKPIWDLLNNLRRRLHYFLRHQDELKVLQEMTESAHRLTEMSQSELLCPIHELAAALEALVSDLHSSPANVNPSALRTVGQCIDFIATLINETNLSQIKDVKTARILAVDDDEGILETIKATMEMVHIGVATSAQSSAGLNMLSGENYDLILLDVGLPEMNGMDICSRVRAMPHHQKTPIVFLTGEATVQNRVQSTLNGGNDMIGKPFSILELAVKVIVWIFKGQLSMV